jgi:ribosomal protein S18 acetylase RimI-like enzyme
MTELETIETDKVGENNDAEKIPISQSDSENIPLKDNTIELINNPLNPQKIQPVYAKKPYPPNKLQITSEFFIDGFPPFIADDDYLKKISPVHKVLQKLDKIFRPTINEIQYRILTKNYIDDFVTLLREHSPVKYDSEYFQKQFERSGTHFSYGAFIEINGIEYLIGYILANLVKERTFFQNVKKIYRTKTCFRSCINYFKTTPERYGVISCLGVIDEYRRMGIGKKLLECMEEELKEKGAIGIMAHLIEHNCSGIKFFEGCNWKYGGFIKQYYNFSNTLYDGQVYYKILFYEDEFDEVEYRGLNEPQIDRQFKIVRLCRLLRNILKY